MPSETSRIISIMVTTLTATETLTFLIDPNAPSPTLLAPPGTSVTPTLILADSPSMATPRPSGFFPLNSSTGTTPSWSYFLNTSVPVGPTLPIPTLTEATLTTEVTVVCTPTSGAGRDMVENGDFEDGLSPWSVDLVDTVSTRYTLSRPGADGSCSAFHVAMLRNQQSEDLRSNLRLISSMTTPLAGTRWAVSFWVRFGSRNAAYVGLFANDQEVQRVGSADAGPSWEKVEFQYTTEDRMLQFLFAFVLGDADANEVWIDKIDMVPVATVTTAALRHKLG